MGRSNVSSGGFVIFGPPHLPGHYVRTIVFVDGYNLYYGLLRKSKFKWLDLVTLFSDHVLDINSQLIEVRYYSAPLLGRLCDDADSPQRQRIYWQALRKHCGGRLKIIEGNFARTTPFLRLAAPIADLPTHTPVQVFALAEKKSDVNLAVDMMDAACNQHAEQIVLCSNDSDFAPALSLIRMRYPGLKIGLVAPIASEDRRHLANDLKAHCDWYKPLSRAHLEKSLMPLRIPSSALNCPEVWR